MKAMLGKVAGWLRDKPVLGQLALRSLPDWPMTISIPTIGRFRIRIRRHRSYWLRDPLTHERFMFGAMQRLIRPGDICYDVGANIGMYSRFLATAFKAGEVVAFEPMAENHRALLENIALSPDAARRVRVLNLALGDRDADELLQVDDYSGASATLDRVAMGKPAQGRRQYGLPPVTETVMVARLDTLLEQGRVPVPNFMKIDIEGAEILMLQGARETLLRHRPRLAIEMHDVDVTRQVLDLLDELGYHVYTNVSTSNVVEYRRVRSSDLAGRTSPYDLHHLLCSTDPEDLREPVPLFTGFQS